jgi:hypothetical protein
VSAAPVVIGLLLALARPGGAAEGDPGEVLARAEAAYAHGLRARGRPEEARRHFLAAAEAYQALAANGARNADLYRDLGNANLLAGRLPEALLAYRAGLLLDPGDGALQEAVEYARDQVRYPSPGQFGRSSAPAWPTWLPWPAPGTLLVLALGSYALACAAGTRWRMTRRAGPRNLAGIALAATLVLGGGWGFRQLERLRTERHPVVVVAADGTPLRLGNGRSYPRHDLLPVLSRGMEARLRFARGDWLQLEFPGDVTGWVQRRQVLVGEP